jgi:uncharacterized protein (TIGR00299 family) protein
MGHEGEGESEHAHEREHVDAHAHEHAHEDHHEHEHAVAEPGEGRNKILFLDAPSGLAGDMIVAALVDLGVPRGAVEGAIAAMNIGGLAVHFGTRARSGIIATSFEVRVDRTQPPRTYADIRAALEASNLGAGVKARAAATFRRLAEAEANVHRTRVEDVHFHEVGAADAIADVVGSAAALDHLGAMLVVSPLPMGRGYAQAAHGKLPLPPPATVECLTGLATYDGGADFEFVTPTGAAIVGAHAARSERWPSMVPERVGWGAGTADLADRPNLLRAVLGAPTVAALDRARTSTHCVVEANVDDATGELAAHWIEALFGAGALDAWASPITMKKGRPALTLSALAPLHRADAVTLAMLRETTSLGVRRYDVARTERPRRIEHVVTAYGSIPVKVAEGHAFGPEQVKPEFDSCVAAARAHGVPVRQVLDAALVAYLRAREGGG